MTKQFEATKHIPPISKFSDNNAAIKKPRKRQNEDLSQYVVSCKKNSWPTKDSQSSSTFQIARKNQRKLSQFEISTSLFYTPVFLTLLNSSKRIQS